MFFLPFLFLLLLLPLSCPPPPSSSSSFFFFIFFHYSALPRQHPLLPRSTVPSSVSLAKVLHYPGLLCALPDLPQCRPIFAPKDFRCLARHSPSSVAGAREFLSVVDAQIYRDKIWAMSVEEYKKKNVFTLLTFHEEYKKKKDVTLLPYAAWVKNETLSFEINRDPR